MIPHPHKMFQPLRPPKKTFQTNRKNNSSKSGAKTQKNVLEIDNSLKINGAQAS